MAESKKNYIKPVINKIVLDKKEKFVLGVCNTSSNPVPNDGIPGSFGGCFEIEDICQ